MRHAVLAALAFVLAVPGDVYSDSAQQQASEILSSSGFCGGIVVHLGAGDGELTAALGREPGYVVHGLEPDAAKVQTARENVRASGRYGRVSVQHWKGDRLPYTDGLVNLIVAEKPGNVETVEMLRVLAPGGVALIREGDGWRKEVKPWPEDVDQWPHYLYGADNNAVSHDRAVGPPQEMQWVCGPAYARSHEINSSMAAMVSAGGRLFYIWDEGPLGQAEKLFPPKWSLIARDGFNGTLLWKIPMPNWGWRQWHDESRWDVPRERAAMLRQLPRTTTRRLVAVGDSVYVTLGYDAPLSVLDAATGEVRRTIDGTAGTDEILLDSGSLILCVRDTERPSRQRGDFRLEQNAGRILAVDPKDGRILWKSEADSMTPLSLAVCGQRVYYATPGQVVCLDRADGRVLWRSETVPGSGTQGTLVAQEKVVLYAYGPVTKEPVVRDYQRIHYHQAHAFSAETGERLWSSPPYRGPSGHSQDIFVIDGLAWFGVDNQGKNLPDHWQDTATQRLGYDLLTGEVKRTVSVPKLTSPGHHYRCYRSKATERYLLLPKRGVEFLDLEGDDHMRHDWLRAPCIYGVMPANGLLYMAPHQCVCYQGVLLSNFNALKASAESSGQASEKVAIQDRLTKGAKYGQVEPVAVGGAPEDWPMYRHDPRRSGSIGMGLPDDWSQRWEARLTGPITPPVVAGSTLLVAEKDAHTLHALDARTGQPRWRFTAGARIDSPPTVFGPLVLFGSTDGSVYCLHLDDGGEVWRFRAAPYERMVGAFEQIESAWPVHGSVVVQDDATSTPRRPLVYFTAGRSTYLDGGIHAFALDPWTGQLVHENCLSGPRPDPFETTGGAGYMDGAKSDILVSDGADLFLLQERFRGDLERVPAPMQELERERGGHRVFPPAPERGSSAKHMMSTRGFLDDSYNEGTYWTYGARWPGWDRHMGRVGAYGQILSFDGDRLYGVHVFYDVVRVRRGFFPGTKGYRLYARDHEATEDRWSIFIPVRVRAMVAAGNRLFVAGPPDVIPEDDPLAAFEGRKGARLWSFATNDGKKVAEVANLSAPPVYDGLIAARQSLYISLEDGRVICFGAELAESSGPGTSAAE